MTRYVGVDLHRRRSVIVVLDSDGTELWTKRIDNDPVTLGLEIENAGPAPEVVLEATWGWYWAADVIAQAGGSVHLAHPLGIKGFENRRVKNDRIDARLLADLLRMGRLPESWIAPEGIRYQRELVRYRRKLSQLRAGLKAQVHAVLGKEGLRPPITHLWGPGGSVWLDNTDMAEAYETRVRSLRRLIKIYDTEITKLDARISDVFEGHEGYEVIQQLNGVGPVLAAIFCAELGDVTRFGSAKQVTSWAGLTPRHRESDTTVHRGSITKQGPPLVRWAAIEAISKNHGDDPIKTHYRRVSERRGRNKGRVAAARKLLTLVYYGLRDGEIRSLVPPEAT
jgi:transposase